MWCAGFAVFWIAMALGFFPLFRLASFVIRQPFFGEGPFPTWIAGFLVFSLASCPCIDQWACSGYVWDDFFNTSAPTFASGLPLRKERLRSTSWRSFLTLVSVSEHQQLWGSTSREMFALQDNKNPLVAQAELFLVALLLVLLSGDIHPNPGPPWVTDYQLLPHLFRLAISALGSPFPYVDALATASNALLPLFWTEECNALSKNWRAALLPIWANPPFSMFPLVLEKILSEGALMLLLIPGWDTWLRAFKPLAKKAFRLPAGVTFGTTP